MKRIGHFLMLLSAGSVFGALTFVALDSAHTQEAPKKSSKDLIEVVSNQTSAQWLASKFKGANVVGRDKQKIGDVKDILIDKKSGHIDAYVIEIGGFLGIGSKDIALSPNAFEIIPGDAAKNEPDQLRLNMTKNELKTATNFEPYKYKK